MTPRSESFAPLRHAAFRHLAIGRLVTTFGNSMAPIALAFAVLDLTGSVRDLGLVVGVRSLMNVVFLLIGGVVADRIPRQHIMVVSGALAASTQAVVAFLVLSGTATIPSLMALSAVNGIVTAFAFPAASALVPQTVPADLLQPANAFNRLGANTAMIIGASVGGILVAAIGPGWVLVVDAATFAVAAVAFSLVRVRPIVMPTAARNPLRDLRDGWREFTSHTWLWTVVLGFMLLNSAYAAALGVLGPAVADNTIGRQAWGLVLAVHTLGMVLGALIALRIRVHRLLRLGVICKLGVIPMIAAMAQAPRLAILIPAALLSGIAYEQFGIAWESTMQRYIPAEKLARVYSYDALGSWIAIPIGQVAAGPAALIWGTSTALIVAAVAILIAVLAMLCSRDVRTLPTISVSGVRESTAVASPAG